MPEAHSSPTAGRKYRFLHAKWAVRVAYLVMSALVILWGLQEQGYGWSSDECNLRSSPQVESQLMEPLYRAVLSLRTHGVSDRVLVVAIDAELQEVQQNVCRGRGFTADLIRELAAQSPAVIAVDKFYGEAACPEGDEGTAALKAVAEALPAQVVSLVVGESTHAPKEGTGESCLVANPQLDLGRNTRQGLTRLNQDVLRLPLSWPVLAEDDDKTPLDKEHSESFALVAATAGNSDLREDEKFTRMLSSHQQPYANLEGELNSVSASDVLCSAGDAQEMARKWGLKCGEHKDLDVKGKVVVVGAPSDSDHPEVLGKGMYGFELQAHYISALFAGGYLRQLPVWVVVVAIVVYYGVLELLIPFLHIHRQPVWARLHIHRALTWTVGAYAVMMLLGLALPLMFRRFPPLGVMLALSGILVPRVLLEGWMMLNERTEEPSRED